MENSIAFITCVNDEIEYEECVRYINKINMPIGFAKEIIPVRNSKSMASGYNYAMKISKSKYKVYLHQDTQIINKNFIYDILNVFKDKDVGMMGVIGCRKLPPDAIWWDSHKQYGDIYESGSGRMVHLHRHDITDAEIYNDVQALDGVILITQYDIPWREDIFDGYHFYDISQCVEFKRNNLKVVVPYQKNTWCLHDCESANMEEYEKYRRMFVEEYSKDLFPLVSILIPTYNRPKYFELALLSALGQTYKNTEIIVGDNSDNDATEKICREYMKKHNNIRYIKNAVNLGINGNENNLLNEASGRYVNYLLDDDLFDYEKIEKMMNVMLDNDNNEISLVSSNRRQIDNNGNCMGNFINDEMIDILSSGKLNEVQVMDYILSSLNNILGEPTTVLFDKTKLEGGFGIFEGREFYADLDMATWMKLLSKGKAVIIKECLSSYRVHEGQGQREPRIMAMGVMEITLMIKNARKYGFLLNDSDYINSIKRALAVAQNTKSILGSDDNIDKEIDELTKLLQEV